ncbi:MAG TPA: hypothetical protein PKM51_05240 [Chitinophagales bacterium]|nr:hypothetical protein [Chitinophagales bacterium]
MDKPTNKNNREVARYIFSGSTNMIGACITVIALFKVMNINYKTYADEIIGINTFIFIFSAFFSYLNLRDNSRVALERIADWLFFIGMTILIFVGLLIVFSTY